MPRPRRVYERMAAVQGCTTRQLVRWLRVTRQLTPKSDSMNKRSSSSFCTTGSSQTRVNHLCSAMRTSLSSARQLAKQEAMMPAHLLRLSQLRLSGAEERG